MPALSLSDILANTAPLLLSRDASSQQSTNATDAAAPFQVICAWPVSGQYGVGSRVLYVEHSPLRPSAVFTFGDESHRNTLQLYTVAPRRQPNPVEVLLGVRRFAAPTSTHA
jgi:hypothetical protein